MIHILHIEKTGISSVEHTLSIQGVKVWNGDSLGVSDFPLDHRESLDAFENLGYRVYCSHFDRYFFNPLLNDNDRPLCTIVREPIDRTLSHVQYLYDHLSASWMKNQPLVSKVIEDVATDINSVEKWKKVFKCLPVLENTQVKRICSPASIELAISMVDRMLIVETFENLQLFYQKVCDHLKIDKVELLNINKRLNPKWNPSNDVKAYIGSMTVLDNELYNYVLRKK
jgi:hypothetical protein